MTKLKQGFTLIELLVVISIIGLLSSVVFASLNNARAKAIMAANKEEARQLANLFALEYLENGSYSNLLRNAWVPSSFTCDTIAVSGNHSTKYREICNSIMNRLGSGSTIYNWLVGAGDADGIAPYTSPVDGQYFSIMIKISPAASTGGQWFCIGSSGRVYNGTYNSSGTGCYYNP